MNLAKNTAVRQIVKPIEGVVTGFQIDQESGARQIQVSYTDEHGTECSRYFQEHELEVVHQLQPQG